jgi:hypothetical protein
MFLSTKTKTPQTITISEMIITLKIPSYNLNKRPAQEPLRFSEEELQEYLSLRAEIKKNKQYAMIIHYHMITIECPILLMEDGSYQIIWPSFKLPNRPYPVFVYLYAAALYLSSGESMRKTAERVIKLFGLATFSHSTISRFLRRIYQTLPELIRYGAQVASEWGAVLSRVIRRKHWDEALYEKAVQLCSLIDPILRAPPEFGNWLAQQYWQDRMSFLV